MRRIALLFIAGLAGLACSRPGPEVLATHRTGELTLADLDRYVRSLPEPRRVAPATGRDDWLKGLIRALAVERLLEASDEVHGQLSSPEAEKRRRWTRAALLADAITRQLAREAPAAEEAVAERLATLKERPAVPRYTFRHIFLRLDRAGTAAEKEAIRRLGRELVRRARAGEDFAELARQHSESGAAAAGGLVENQRPARLEASARQAIAKLVEGEMSDLVETRTGLHIFKLVRRVIPKGAAQSAERLARNLTARESLAAARTELLTDLHRRIEVSTEEYPWQVGSFVVAEADLPWIAGSGPAVDDRQQAIVEHLLLADEGRRRGLDTDKLAEQVDAGLRREAIQTAYQRRRAELVGELPAEHLRATYDAQPSTFGSPRMAHLDLIFVTQGRDAFATQQQLEAHVEDLRAGGSFADLAGQISTGPGAGEGGDLGLLPPSEWARLGPEIYKAVTALEAGEISVPIYCTDRVVSAEPRLLRGGFAILRVRGQQPPREQSFEEAIDDVRAVYARRNAGEIDEQLWNAILDQAEFEIVRLPEPGELLQ